MSGLSKLTSDPRAAIRKSALEVLFNILKDHGHLFSQSFWGNVFKCAIFPLFNSIVDGKEAHRGMMSVRQILDPYIPQMGVYGTLKLV
ncbi:Protein big1 [Orobanche gracilis]